MSDIADLAQWRIEQDLCNTLAHVKKSPALEADGFCYFCDETIQHELLFCNVDCRDDFEKEQQARQRAGTSSKR